MAAQEPEVGSSGPATITFIQAILMDVLPCLQVLAEVKGCIGIATLNKWVTRMQSCSVQIQVMSPHDPPIPQAQGIELTQHQHGNHCLGLRAKIKGPPQGYSCTELTVPIFAG